MLKTIVDKLLELLSHPYFSFVVLIIAILLSLPMVNTGWFADDYLHRAAYVNTPDGQLYQPTVAALKGPMMMYSFLDGDPERFHRMLDYGGFPWWCSPDFHASLWRPITALLSMLDYWLWADSSELMHIHSLFWFAVLILVSGVVYKQILGAGWAAGLAVLLYIICDIQCIPIAFLANRHILIAAVFGVGAVGAYFHWRKQKQNRWAVLSCLLYTAALFSSESGIAVFSYLMAHSLWIEKGKILSRIQPLIPFILISVVWRVIYTSLGYGISGVEFYVDPGKEPLQFAVSVLARAPMILLHTIVFPPSDLSPIIIVIKLYWVLVICVLVCFGILCFPQYRNCRISLFFLFGTLFSTIPLCAAFPGGRSLALVSFGMTGFLAQIFYHAVTGRDERTSLFSWHSITCTVLFGIIFLRLLIGSYNLNQGHKVLQMAQRGLNTISELHIDDPGLSEQDVILVNPPITIFVGYVISNRLVENKTLPAHIRILGSGLESIEIERADENTLLVRPKDGYLCPPDWNKVSLTNFWSYPTLIQSLRHIERLMYNRNHPFTLGQTFELTGVTIRITKITDDNRPAEATFVFDLPLEDSTLRWLRWNKKEWKYENYVPPDVGEKVLLK